MALDGKKGGDADEDAGALRNLQIAARFEPGDGEKARGIDTIADDANIERRFPGDAKHFFAQSFANRDAARRVKQSVANLRANQAKAGIKVDIGTTRGNDGWNAKGIGDPESGFAIRIDEVGVDEIERAGGMKTAGQLQAARSHEARVKGHGNFWQQRITGVMNANAADELLGGDIAPAALAAAKERRRPGYGSDNFHFIAAFTFLRGGSLRTWGGTKRGEGGHPLVDEDPEVGGDGIRKEAGEGQYAHKFTQSWVGIGGEYTPGDGMSREGRGGGGTGVVLGAQRRLHK